MKDRWPRIARSRVRWTSFRCRIRSVVAQLVPLPNEIVHALSHCDDDVKSAPPSDGLGVIPRSSGPSRSCPDMQLNHAREVFLPAIRVAPDHVSL
eukprot:2029919-Rhodomonas_salina.1